MSWILLESTRVALGGHGRRPGQSSWLPAWNQHDPLGPRIEVASTFEAASG